MWPRFTKLRAWLRKPWYWQQIRELEKNQCLLTVYDEEALATLKYLYDAEARNVDQLSHENTRLTELANGLSVSNEQLKADLSRRASPETTLKLVQERDSYKLKAECWDDLGTWVKSFHPEWSA